MNKRLVIEVHVGKRYGASRLNCDENGKMKAILIDGKKHSRISSQAKKAAWRKHFNEVIDEKAVTYRTRAIANIIEKRFEKMKNALYCENAKELAEFLVTKIMGVDSKKEELTSQLLVFTDYDINDIIESFCNIVKEDKDLERVRKAAAKSTTDSFCTSIVNDIKRKLPLRRESVECALFGRMVTSKVMKTVESSICVNHSIAFGKNQTEMDYFTAIDNYLSDSGDDVGAAHINRKEFGSSVYYEYASIDVGHFYNNLCNGVDMTVSENKERVKEVMIEAIKALLYEIVFVAPTGAQNSFASSPDPVGVYVTIRDKGSNRTADVSVVSTMNPSKHYDTEADMFVDAMYDFTKGVFSGCNTYIKNMYAGYKPEKVDADQVCWKELVTQIEEIINERF